MTTSEEQEFVEQLRDPKTQHAAFKRLVELYGRALYRHIRNYLIDHDDTDDVLQNTFIKVFRHIDGFKGESRLYSWIYKIATNEALTFLKQKAKKNRMSSGEHQLYLLDHLEADSYLEPETVTIALHKAVSQLPDKQQLVFKMKYFEDMKYEEISEILGTSVGALKASYHHAVRKIEDYFKND